MHEPEATAITSSITSSLVLAADDPAALAQFYGVLLGVAPQPGLSGTHWRVLQTWISTALDLGATSEDPARQEPFGAEAWLLDPEGNRLLLLVLP